VDCELLGDVTDIETIASGRGIRTSHDFGACMAKATGGRRKAVLGSGCETAGFDSLKSVGYEAHGIGKKEFKRKRYPD